MNRRGFLAFLITAPLAKSLPWEGIARFIEPIAPQTAAAINLTIAEIISETLRRFQPELIANIESNNALLKRLTKK